MNDTSPEMNRRMCEMMQQKLPFERLKMGFSMYDMSKRLVIQSILQNHPHFSSADLREEVFKKFYSNDFTPEVSAKIILHLRNLPDRLGTVQK